MLKDLVKIANKLDSLGLSKEADIIDSFIRRAQFEDMSTEEMDYSSLPGDVRDFIRESEKVLAPDVKDFITESKKVLDQNVYHHFIEGFQNFLSTGGTPNINILMKLVEEAKTAQ